MYVIFRIYFRSIVRQVLSDDGSEIDLSDDGSEIDLSDDGS